MYISIFSGLLLRSLSMLLLTILLVLTVVFIIVKAVSTPSQSKTQPSEKKPVEKTDVKNILILISGSVLIVLAAIVFLATSWHSIPNVVKTITLVLLDIVFFALSYVAKAGFKLKQTAKTFKYIGLLYIPIVLISISVLRLFGDIITVGQGKYIYYSVCTIFLSILYFIEASKNKSYLLTVFSLLFQALAVVSVVNVFTSDISVLVFGLLLYSFFANRLYNKEFLKSQHLEESKDLFLIDFIVISVLSVIPIYNQILTNTATVFTALGSLILTLNFIVTKFDGKRIKVCYDLGLLFTILTFISIKDFHLLFMYKLLTFSLAAFVLYTINYLTAKSKGVKLVYKMVSYTSLVVVLISLFNIYNLLNYLRYIPVLVFAITLFIESISKEKNMRYYLFTLFIISSMALTIKFELEAFLSLLLSSAVYSIYIKATKQSDWFLITPAVALLPYIFISNIELLFKLENIDLNLIFAIVILLLGTLKSIIKKKFNEGTVISIIYMILFAMTMHVNTYIKLAIPLVWAISHALTHKTKTWYLITAYIFGLAIYHNIVNDLDIAKITVINYLGDFVVLYAVTNTIIKETTLARVLEYLFTLLIYFFAFNSYTDVTDAIIFTSCIFIAIVIGYIKKNGPMFLISLIAFVLNFIKLTIKFWTGIPWYAYMLIAGSALIIFAIINEANAKKEKKKTLGSAFQKIFKDMNF